ncbi:hypothetical protein BGY98DRAFT_984312 [Russula aff. rugulosa BPL654]|nr:hypothetical protein BGY98DRAFT_984312 [Russula aff. rugulosa BPL654]
MSTVRPISFALSWYTPTATATDAKRNVQVNTARWGRWGISVVVYARLCSGIVSALAVRDGTQRTLNMGYIGGNMRACSKR